MRRAMPPVIPVQRTHDQAKKYMTESIRPRTISDYIHLARRRKALIAVPAAVVIAASLIAIFRLPDSYQSSTFILVEPPQGETAGEGAPIDLQRRLATVRQQVTSRSNLQGLISQFSLYPREVNRGEPIDSIIAQMRTDIDVDVNSTRPDATDAFTISYRSASPEVAQKVTTALTSELIAENVQALESEASGQADVLKARSTELSAQLHEMEIKSPWLISLREDSPLALPAGIFQSAGSSVDSIRQHQMAIGTIRDQQYKIQQQIDELDRRISDEKQSVDKQKKSTLPTNNATFGALVAKRAELHGQRDNLLKSQGLTEKHPRVIVLSDQIDSINKAIEELKRQEAAGGVQSPEERELASLEMQRGQLKIELQVAQRELDRQAANPPIISHATGGSGPAIPRDAGSARLAQDYLGLKQTYKEIAGKLQQAELQSQAMGSGKVARFRILDQANLPEEPSWPNRKLLALAAVGFGLGVGICVLLAVEFTKFGSLQDARDVEHYTGLPLLGSIPRTTTAAQRRREIRGQRFRLAVGAAAAAVATIVLAKMLLIAHLFEMVGRK